jgi:hypothetical protein
MSDVTQTPETEADFGRLSWDGCRIWKLEIAAGDGRADLVLGLDLVVDALCGFNREARFKLAPATLTFHTVTDLKIGIDCGDSGNLLMVQPLSIAEISRTATASPSYYVWRIRLGWPRGGELSFGAAGFTQVLLAEPIISGTNFLSEAQRRRMLTSRPGRVRTKPAP